jgi:hypothetical protein
MIAPATGYYPFKTGDTINLRDYSLTANQVANSERIEVFILGYEDDGMGPGSKLINTAIDTLTDGLVSRALPAQQALSQIAGGLLPSELLEWWRQQELLGEYIMVLNQSNDWNIGTHSVRSTNGNLDITYTILRSTELQESPSDTVALTIRNDSSQTIQTIYLWPSDANSWRNRASIELGPGAAETFVLETGVYDLRAEGGNGLYWEQGAIDLSKDQTWTISQ